MTTTRQIAAYDVVELTERIDDTPAGVRGGVLDICSDGTAMVEITSLPGAMDIDRIVVAPLAKLRVVDGRRRTAS